jgi:hypothetical protein
MAGARNLIPSHFMQEPLSDRLEGGGRGGWREEKRDNKKLCPDLVENRGAGERSETRTW